MIKSVNILGRKYKINYVDAIDHEGCLVEGLYHFGTQAIHINKHLDQSAMSDVLTHEIMHGILTHTGAHNNFTDDQIETICDLAPLLIQTMRGIK